MAFEVELILASVAEQIPIYTFRLKYWRAIHSEVMTHRVFSRNAGSSRAIPVKKMLEQIRLCPAGPTNWGKNQKGMQAHEQCNEFVIIPKYLRSSFAAYMNALGDCGDGTVIKQMQVACPREIAWAFTAWNAAAMSEAFSDAGYHKQIANRPTEPFQWINVVLTSTRWQNFFDLRCHPDAMPEFQDIAWAIQTEMLKAKDKNLIQHLDVKEWHMPFVTSNEKLFPIETQLKLSTSRCASTSYKTVEGFDMSMDSAEAIFHKLVGSDPIHASPSEHQAQVRPGLALDPLYTSNFHGPWVQHRKFIENRNPLNFYC